MQVYPLTFRTSTQQSIAKEKISGYRGHLVLNHLYCDDMA